MRRVLWGGLGVAALISLSCSKGAGDATPTSKSSTIVEGARARFHFRANGEPALRTSSEHLFAKGELLATASALANVEYPARADQPVHVVDGASGLDARIAVVGAAERAREEVDGLVVYRDALAGAPIMHRATSAGTEDFVVFERAPAVARVSYSVSLGEKVLGLRLVGNVVELLDAGGAPRLRVASPWLVGSDGDVTDARLSIEGCSYDSDPAPPWGRATVDPGARTCTVSVTWDRDAVAYPALLDPAWQSAGTMGPIRNNATVTRCSSGSDKILVAGGMDEASAAVLASAVVFNATTSTWATTASMTTARYSAVALADPRATFANPNIVVTGGRNGAGTALGVNEQWNCSTGLWSSAGTFDARWGHALSFGPNTRLFAVGGRSGTSTMVAKVSQIDFGSSGSWQSWSGPARAELTAYSDQPWAFPNGSSGHEFCVIWMGGREASGAASNKTGYLCYGSSDGEYSGEASMPLTSARFGHKLVAAGSQILLIGGNNGTSDLSTVDVFTPGAFKFGGTPLTGISAGAPMPVARNGHVAVAINANDVLVAGGAGSAATTSHLFLGGSGTWISVGPLLGSHGNGIASAALPGDGALVVGGPSSPERWARGVNGATCTENGECATNFCVDGVCCNTACNTTCQSCTNLLKGSGSDGTCGPTRNGGADSACGTSSASSCGDDGTCNGAGACRKWPSGTECQAQSCASVTQQNNRRTCNGTGTCQTPTTTTCNTAYACTANGCATSCTGTDDTKCAPGYYCNGSACVTGLPKATTCTRDRQCGSGFCTDGVCCAIACRGTCEACSAALKESGVDGECGLVPANKDPRNQCAQDPGYPNSCKSDGMCNGAGACRSFAVAGTNCGTDTCITGKATTSRCDGGGACSLTETACAPASCNSSGTACAGGCALDTDCSSTAYCDTATSKCVAKKPNGDAATEGRVCQSGIAADGMCCNTACAGICEACDGTATKGTCTAVAGAPHAGHGMCDPGGTGEDACKKTVCDGTERTTCAGKDAAALCREASCTDGVETLATSCNGTGACPAASTKNCQPYACDSKTCRVKCAANTDCATGFFCDPATGICGAGASCVDEKTLKRSDGTTETCVAFKCSGQQCLKTCTSTTDCLSGYICNSGSSQCEAAPAVEDDGGCAVGSPGSNPTRAAWILFALMTLGVTRRSRRRNVLVHRAR